MEFLKNQPMFSFQYGGKSFTESLIEEKRTEEGDTVTTVYRLEGGLTLTNVLKYYQGYGACEWVNYLENTGSENTPLISELYDCDCRIPVPHQDVLPSSPWTPNLETTMYVITPNGSTHVDEYDFYSHVDDSCRRTSFLFPGKSPRKLYSSVGGRSSNGNAPFFNVHENGKGYFICVGWTGQWNCQFNRETDALRVRSKIEDTHFVLYPGERIRTSSTLILPYECSVEDSFNRWRRFLRDCLSPLAGRIDRLPLSLGIWGGTPSEEIIRRIETNLDRAQIPFDCVWMDAGWCGVDTVSTPNEFSGDWANHVGDWAVSPLIHENGLRDVAEEIHKRGKRYVLWFEPERVKAHLPLAKEHPEYLLTGKNPKDTNRLMNLGNEEALAYCIEFISELVERLHVDCYRQDFNFDPLNYWRNTDTPDRVGISEIKHIMGLYRMWDTLLERFPHLYIDNCASGGKRLDIETLRRSVPLWRSDAQCPADPVPEITQANHMNFSLWMPYSGTGSGRVYDTYRMRSAYAPALSTTYSYSSDEHFGDNADEVAWMKAHAEEFLRVREYFDGDVYHLTPPTRDDASWSAVQWNRPEQDDGMIQVFRRAKSIYPTAVLELRKIREDARYLFTDADGGEWEVDGATLAKDGFVLSLPEKRTAKIYFYRAVTKE